MKILSNLSYIFLALIHASQSLPTSKLPANQNHNNDKRDLTVSYAATDIGLNPGTHVKTLTFFKNVNDRKGDITSDIIKTKPKVEEKKNVSELEKQFKFFGSLPEVPDDIDELFDFVNRKNVVGSGDVSPVEEKFESKKKKNKEEGAEKKSKEEEKPKEENKPKEEEKPKEVEKEKPTPKEVEKEQPKPKKEEEENISAEEVDGDFGDIEEKVTKIYGDAELINSDKSKLKLKSQSISEAKEEFVSRYVYANDPQRTSNPNAPQYVQSAPLYSTTTVAPYIAPVLRKHYRLAPATSQGGRNQAQLQDQFTGYSISYQPQPQQSFRSSVPRFSGRVKRRVMFQY